MSSEEVWVPIEGYSDYHVSNRGRVYNTVTDRMMTTGIHKGAFRRVNLYDKGVLRGHYVHRLVAKHFIPGWREGIGVKHHNGDSTDNRVENLYYEGRIRERANPNLKVKIIETGEVFDNVAAVARHIKGQPYNVRRVMDGTLSRHKGYTFMYVSFKYAS